MQLSGEGEREGEGEGEGDGEGEGEGERRVLLQRRPRILLRTSLPSIRIKRTYHFRKTNIPNAET